MKYNLENAYYYLAANEYFTEDELILVTGINGYNTKTIDKMVKLRYECKNFKIFLSDYAEEKEKNIKYILSQNME